MKSSRIRNFLTAVLISTFALTVSASAAQTPPGDLVTPTLGGINLEGNATFNNTKAQFLNSAKNVILNLNGNANTVELDGSLAFFGADPKKHFISGLWKISTKNPFTLEVLDGQSMNFEVNFGTATGNIGTFNFTNGDVVLDENLQLETGDLIGNKSTTDIVASSLDLGNNLNVGGDLTVNGWIDTTPFVTNEKFLSSSMGTKAFTSSCPDESTLVSCQISFTGNKTAVTAAGTMLLFNSCLGSYQQTRDLPVTAMLQNVCM